MIDGLTPRDRIWREVRSLSRFSIDDLALRARCEVSLVQSYVFALQNAGFIGRETETTERREDGSFPRVTYRLIRDCGVQAPRLGPNGGPVRGGEAQQAAWTACRILRAFTWRDVARAMTDGEVTASDAAVKAYVLALARAGYFEQISPARPGVPTRWRLRNNTGPKAPLIQRTKRVWDANIGRVMWERSEGLGELDEPRHESSPDHARAPGHIPSSVLELPILPLSGPLPLRRPPEWKPVVLNHVQAAIALRRLYSIDMSRGRFAWLEQRYPGGVSEDEISSVASLLEAGNWSADGSGPNGNKEEALRMGMRVAGEDRDELAGSAHAWAGAKGVA